MLGVLSRARLRSNPRATKDLVTYLNSIDLISGWLPITLLALGLLGGLWVCTPLTRRRGLLLVGVLAGVEVLLVLVSWICRIPHLLSGTFPATFFLWVGAVPTLAVAVILAWGSRRWWANVVAVGVVCLSVFTVADVINAFYGYVPTIGALDGAPLAGQVSALPHERRSLPTAGPDQFAAVRVLPRQGVLAPFAIAPTVSGFQAQQAWVWLPPIYLADDPPALPALELLGGTPSQPQDWMYAGHAIDTLNAFAAANQGWGPVVVFVDGNGSATGDSECVNRPGALAETYLTVDVINAAAVQLHVSARNWSIAGDSEGGTCALVLALRHPDIYQAFGDFGGDPAPTLGDPVSTFAGLYGNDRARAQAHTPRWLLSHRPEAGTGAFCVGQSDQNHRSRVEASLRQARAAGLAANLFSVVGAHDFYSWTACLQVTLASLAGSVRTWAPQQRAVDDVRGNLPLRPGRS